MIHAPSWAQFGVSLAGTLQVGGVMTTMYLMVIGMAVSELWSWYRGKLGKSFVSADIILQVAREQGYLGSTAQLPDDPLRMLTGISMVFNLLAGFLYYHRDKGWLAAGTAYFTIFSNIVAQLKVAQAGNMEHWVNFLLGWMLGFVLPVGKGMPAIPGKGPFESIITTVVSGGLGFLTTFVVPVVDNVAAVR